MTRKFSRNSSLSVVVPFIAILIFLIAAAVLAQTSGAGQTTGKANAMLAPVGTSALAQAGAPANTRDRRWQFSCEPLAHETARLAPDGWEPSFPARGDLQYRGANSRRCSS